MITKPEACMLLRNLFAKSHSMIVETVLSNARAGAVLYSNHATAVGRKQTRYVLAVGIVADTPEQL